MDKILEKGIEQVLADYERISGLNCVYHDLSGDLFADFKKPVGCDFCDMILGTENGCFHCRNQRNVSIQKSILEYEWNVIVCHAGLLEWVVPVFYKGSAIGVFISGFVSNSESNNQEFLDQMKSYIKHYRVEEETYLSAVATLPTIDREKVKPYAQLLFALTRLYIVSGRALDKELKVPDTTDVFFFDDPELLNAPLPKEPLTHFILDPYLDVNSLNVFWKTVEKQANSIFINVMAGRVVEARTAYWELMQLAVSEESLTYAKNSAEMLFHIIFLKYYQKSLYDVRFYQLAFGTIDKLYNAATKEKVKSVMMNAFDSLYSIFNASEATSYNSSITKTIMKYLEENYQKNIKVEDIAKVVYLSPAYVSRLFKKETSFTIKWCLNNIRMLHAQEYLINTNMPIKDISLAVGYTDIRGFYKMFAKHFGITCSQMRKKYSNMK